MATTTTPGSAGRRNPDATSREKSELSRGRHEQAESASPEEEAAVGERPGSRTDRQEPDQSGYRPASSGNKDSPVDAASEHGSDHDNDHGAGLEGNSDLKVGNSGTRHRDSHGPPRTSNSAASRKELTVLPEEEPEQPTTDTSATRVASGRHSPHPKPRTRKSSATGVGAEQPQKPDEKPEREKSGEHKQVTWAEEPSREEPGEEDRRNGNITANNNLDNMGVVREKDASDVHSQPDPEEADSAQPPTAAVAADPPGSDSGVGSANEETVSETDSSVGPVGTVPRGNRAASSGSTSTGDGQLDGKVKPFTGKSTLNTRSSTLSSTGAPAEQGEDDVDSINVAVRVRPPSTQESQRKDSTAVHFPGNGSINVTAGNQSKSFTFNVTFEPEATQEDVFEHCGVKKLVEMALDGYSCTAFAFGQTGSGKTHSITGPPELFEEGSKPAPALYGLIPRSFHYLFRMMIKRNGSVGTGYRLFASYMEIYNEQVIDLLNPNNRRPLSVRWSKNKGFYVENLFVLECETMDDIMAVLEEGLRNRATGSNSVNEHSSRSHSMLTLHIDSEVQDPEDENVFITKHGKLTFVDLAGSEKVKTETQNTAGHLAESNNINKSLLVLGNCISALGDPKRRQGHIPYRDSKLTKLLADSLGGNGVTLMIACISPSAENGAESLNTLRYANRAKKIKTKPAVKMDPREKLIMTLKRELKVLRQENHYLRNQLKFPAKSERSLQGSDTGSDGEIKEAQSEKKEENLQEGTKEQQEKDETDDEDEDDSLNFPAGKKGAGLRGRLEFPDKPKGQLQREVNERRLKMMEEQEKEGTVVKDHGLYEMLQEYMIENETLRTENSDLHQLRDTSRREQQMLARDNERLLRKIDAIERDMYMIQTPLSEYSLGSTILSRQTSASDASVGRAPPYSPQAWGHNTPIVNGVRVTGRGPMEPVGNAWGTPQGTPRGNPYGSTLASEEAGRGVPINGPVPSYSGPGRSRQPPSHLQHPMRPPHRLSEPVTKNTQSPSPSGHDYGAQPPGTARTFVVQPRSFQQENSNMSDFANYISGYAGNNQRNQAGYMNRFYQQQDFYRDNPPGYVPQAASYGAVRGQPQLDYQSSSTSQANGSVGPQQNYGPNYYQGPPSQGFQQGAPTQGYPQGVPPQGYPQGTPPQNYPPGVPPQGYQQVTPPQGHQQGVPPQGYQQGPTPQGYQQGATPQKNNDAHLPADAASRARQPAKVQHPYGQEAPKPAPRKTKGGSYAKNGPAKKTNQAAAPPPAAAKPAPQESVSEMNERLKRELADIDGAIKQESLYKGVKPTNSYGAHR